jgi:hypothetical protein
LFLKTDSQTNEEVMSKSNQEYMMMPAQPISQFVMIQPDFAFGFFKDGFDGPTLATHAYKLNQGSFSGIVAEVVFNSGRAVLSKTGEELTAFREIVFKEFSEEELATMDGLMRKLQIAAQVNYAKHIKK